MKSVMVFGTFDILHIGHLTLFERARRYGDTLTVVLARDERVKALKGELPIHTALERKKILSQVRIVDKVILGDKHDVYRVVKNQKPNTIVLGYDQQAFVPGLMDYIQKNTLSIRIVRLPAFQSHRHKTGILKKKILTSKYL